jgi:hypothetical protein
MRRTSTPNPRRAFNARATSRAVVVVAGVSLMLVSTAWPEVDAEPSSGEWIVVRANEPPPSAGGGFATRYGPTRDDFERVLDIPGVRAAVPVRELQRDVRYGEATVDARIVGTTSDAALSRNLQPRTGRLLTARDEQRSNNVAVLDSVVANRLFPHVDPLGRNVRFGDEYFLVVGVLAEPMGRVADEEHDRVVYVPYSTMLSRFGEIDVRRNGGVFEVRRFEMNGIDLLVDPTRRPQIAEAVRELLDAGATRPGAYEVDVRRPPAR